MGKSANQKKAKSSLEEIREEEERRKERKNRKDYWLFEHIVVKIVTKRLGDRYHKKKAVVVEVVEDDYTAVVKLVTLGGYCFFRTYQFDWTFSPSPVTSVKRFHFWLRCFVAATLSIDGGNVSPWANLFLTFIYVY